MTIFDSIKYPVSDPPTGKELTNLPSAIYNKWMELWNDDGREMLTPVNIAAYYYYLHNDIGNDNASSEIKELYKLKLDALKRIILEHDNL
jgi:hypothetical protein